jgi:DNA-binding MarR family transcriptional regulator
MAEAGQAKRGRKAAEVQELDPQAAIDLGSLPNQLGYVLRRAQATVIQTYAAPFAEAGLRPAQYSVLTILDRNPGLSPSHVADALAINRTNFVPLFDSLVRRGFAERRPVATSRRTHALYLTTAGKAQLDKASRLLIQHEQLFASKLGSGNLDCLVGLLLQLTEALVESETAASDAAVQRRSPRRSRRSRLDGFV